MQSDTERAITLVANVVAICVFVCSIIGWLGFGKVFPAPVTDNKNVVYSLLVAYAALASYGTATFLRQRVEAQKPTILLALLIGIAYAFACVYLQDFLTASLPQKAEVVANTTPMMPLIYVVTHFFIYIVRVAFPAGFTFWRWFTMSFRREGWLGLGLLLLYLFGQLYMFSLFRGHP